MVRRLVLGCGHAGRTVVGVVSTWGGDLRVVAPDPPAPEEVETATEVVRGDPTDPETYPESVDVVAVLGDDPEQNVAAAERARESFPDALLVASTGGGATDRLEAVADRVVDTRAAVTERALGTVSGDDGERVWRLLTILRRLDGPLAVVMHDNPDPDAIASGITLAEIARSVGVEADVCYYGEIAHQENRALVNVLDLDLRNLGPEEGVGEYAGVALVDHSRPGVNDGLDPGIGVDVVVDHHPPRAPVDARLVDLRGDVGATSTLLVEYLNRLGLDPSRTVATALLYGIRTDTREFTREAVEADFEAAAFLCPHVDTAVLERVESPSMGPEVLSTLATAIQNRDVRGEALTTGVGPIHDRSVLAQAADKLLDMEGICLSVVYGFIDETVYVSARTRGTDVDIGAVLRDALGAIGSAGGHAEMAGAQIPLGVLGAIDGKSTDPLTRIVDDIVAERIFEVLEDPPNAPIRDPSTGDVGFEFPLADDG
jgi:nanoRNase/pAp phosphatase (c-di-AMP/oligoRNAs hydrolase)